MLISHADDRQGLAILDNLCTALEFAKLRFSVLDLKRQRAWPGFGEFAAIVICTEHIEAWQKDKGEELQAYLQAGGGLLVAYRGWNDRFSDLFGVLPRTHAPAMHITTGLEFVSEIFPDVRGLKIGDLDWLFEHSRFDLGASELAADCHLLATDGTGLPIAWKRRVGQGHLCYWNTGALFCRALRGFLLQCVLDVMGTGVCAIPGFAMLHVDDFPPALSNAREEPVAQEFPGIDQQDFYFDIWYEDMMALRRRHDLKVTWYSIMDYDDDAPVRSSVPTEETLADARRILRERFRLAAEAGADGDIDEYGFHGFNHVPLIEASWPDLNVLRQRLELARTFWQDIVPAPLPASWVPANNWYEEDHVRALKAVFPEITAVCSLYSSGITNRGGYREFAREPWEDGLVCLPRDTYGYVCKPDLRMIMLSQLSGMGAWTHFVHPDDVYDVPRGLADTPFCRNPEGAFWRARRENGAPGLLAQFDSWLTRVRSSYPWLEFLTTSQGERRLRSHLGNDVEVWHCDDEIEISTREASLFYIRVGEGIQLSFRTGAEMLDQRKVDGGTLYVVRCEAGRTKVGLTRV
nr:DUF2194 domain-containing protein [Pseudohoeflea sp. DP4N28-3]